MGDLDAIRAEQLAHEQTRYDNLAAVLKECSRPASDWSYRPSESDDWTQWCTVARFAAANARYRQTGETVALLTLGHGPYFCPTHEDRPSKDWRARQCLDCWWEDAGYDQALTTARTLGRQWVQQTRQMAARGAA